MRLSPELVTGFEEIDGQHRVLLARLAEAGEAARRGDRPATQAAMAALADDLAAHFAAEEALMAGSAYPERGRHRSAHELFMHDFNQLGEELAAVGLSLPTVNGITVRVPEWLRFHIIVNDIPLGRHLASRRPRAEQLTAGKDKPRTS